GRAHRRLNPKSSLFSLFSRPRVEKQRGFNESGYAVTPIIEPGRATPSPDPIIRVPQNASNNGSQAPYPRPSTSLSIHEDRRNLARSRTTTSSDDAREEEDVPILPSLFDIYSDSSKVTIAQAIDESGQSRLTRPRKSNASHITPAHIHEERRGSVDSIKGEYKAQSRSGRNSLSQGPFQRKIFALSNDGIILQYPEKGGGERLPERALQLGSESVAFACDLVPGRPYVLQVDQKPNAVSDLHTTPSQTSLLTKIGLKDNLPRVGDHSILIILDTAEELTSWMNAVRKQIQLLGAVMGNGLKPEGLEKPSTMAPKLRVKQRTSINQQDLPSFTNFSFPTSSLEMGTISRPRCDSSAAVTTTAQPEVAELHSYTRRNSNAATSRKPIPDRDNVERLRKMASFDTNDSPLSVTTHDSAVSFGMSAGKRMIRDNHASHKSSIGSLHDEFDSDSPVLPRSATTGQLQRPKPNPIVGRPRPDSFVADLPLLWPARKPSEGATTSMNQQTPSPPMKRLPLKVNLHSDSMSLPRQRPSQSPQKLAPPPTRALPALPTVPSRPIENFSRKPQRTPSIKLSLFPNADVLVNPTSVASPAKLLPPSPAMTLPPSPADDVARSQDRPLRRPASIQIRTNHAPFLSSVRPKTAGNRPQLSKAGSVPCLREASSLPRAPMVQKPSSSPLPPLDLGMPIVGLAPPAPPPSLPLPKLPPGARALAIAQECFDESVPTMIKPGAGLTQLDLNIDNTDTLFDSIFTAAPMPPTIELDNAIPRQTGSVRRYRSDSDILDAYYTWLHPYFPILPPSRTSQPQDNPQLWFPGSSESVFESRSPAALAISAILALIPHPEEYAPFEEESIKARREAAHAFAKCALESIESDSEIPNSSISPAQALLDEKVYFSRPAFHPRVPIEAESVVALSTLSVYEYAQRGNITKMRDRAGQALMMAMNLSLHDRGTELDTFAEARSRIWWMSYICACQASIVSSAPPAIPLFDPRFTTTFPQSPDPEAWPFFIKSQQTILLATQFVSAVGRAVDGREDSTDISSRMQELHNTIEPLIAQSYNWTDIKPDIHDPEAIVAYSLKQMSKIKLNSARIKVHRYCAFFDIPVFSEKHCDLKKSEPLPPPTTSADPLDQIPMDSSPNSCGCSSTSLPTQVPGLTNSVSPPNSTSSASSAEYLHPFPFSNHFSSRLCLNSALAIASAFETMPVPISSSPLAPRTMPSFACCAMQSAYALLMVYHRTWVLAQQNTDAEAQSKAAQLLGRCEEGLRRVLQALDNYSIAFEALGGMRDQIQAAVDCLSLTD
ncbi:hypothetical protein KCU86_g6856, partial [Aureobasidium melanogenum]